MYTILWRNPVDPNKYHVYLCDTKDGVNQKIRLLVGKMNKLFGNNDNEQAWPRIVWPLKGVDNCLREGEIMVIESTPNLVASLGGFHK